MPLYNLLSLEDSKLKLNNRFQSAPTVGFQIKIIRLTINFSEASGLEPKVLGPYLATGKESLDSTLEYLESYVMLHYTAEQLNSWAISIKPYKV